jgi:asparagine synthase (glutamine-hydrolysing)
MCGFAGLIDPHRATSAPDLEAAAASMAATVAHRGPDSFGVWSDAQAGVALGHQRLAIIDLSPEGDQPMVSGSGRYVVAYNGEVYNFPALRQELETGGAKFRGHSDTEVVVEAIDQWGLERALERFIGMFAFALWDRDTRRLTLARDRLGIKPVYWGHAGAAFVFGSELRALTAHPEFDRKFDRDAVALYALQNNVPAPWSIYKNAHKLEAGTRLDYEADTGAHAVTRFWSLQQTAKHGLAHPFRGDRPEAVDKLNHLLGEVVGCRMVADVPLGVFLSGGIDSSTVAALMQSQSTAPVKTFSIGFPDADYNEAKDAAAVADHLGTDHHELYVTDREARDVVPRLGALYDEPFADSSQIPTFLVSEMTRRHVTVALSGDGGDEVFGGYNRYLWSNALARQRGILPAPLRRGLSGLLSAIPPHSWDRLFKVLRPVLPDALQQRNSGDKLHKLATVLAAPDSLQMYRQLIHLWPSAEVITGQPEPANLLSEDREAFGISDSVDLMMILDSLGYLPNDILTKVDRASMAVSLEARVPMLDHRLLAFAWSLPQAWKIDDSTGKAILRDVLAKYVPPALTNRPKMGFATPIGDWLRGPLRGWAEELLNDQRLNQDGFFDASTVRRTWHEHLSGRRNHAHRLWPILMLGQWSDEQRRDNHHTRRPS